MNRTLVGHKVTRTSTVTVLVEPELRARLEAAAQRNERSMGGEVRAALRVYLDADTAEEDA